MRKSKSQLGKQIILNCERMERRFALLNNGRLEEYQIERDDKAPKVGDVYLGRIVNLDSSLQAAFVDIGAEKNAFLHYHDMLPGYGCRCEREDSDNDELMASLPKEELPIQVKRRKWQAMKPNSKVDQEAQRRRKGLTSADIPSIFRPGMEILVQVVKAPISTKGARITTDISIAGRYLVLMPYSEHIALSSRIEGGTERDRLRKILAALELPEGMGVICRTVGEGQRSTFFKRDLELLLDSWRKIEKDLDSCKAPVLLYTEPNLVERTIRDFMTEEFQEIVVDDPEANRMIVEKLKRIGGRKMATKVRLYNASTPIFETYQINDQLQEVFRREVKLPSGGAIVLDETEALIAIDVNSGRGRKGADQPEFILQTNLEAAVEIARQLRLRNIGGLVVLDFIDMRSAKDREEVYRTMKRLVKGDRAKTKILPLSRLGLMEMTRQREHESISDQVHMPCPYCKGSGLVKSEVSMSVEIQRCLNAVLRESRFRNRSIRVIMHPDILQRMHSKDAKLLQELENRYKNDLSFRADPMLHSEEFKLIDPETGEELK